MIFKMNERVQSIVFVLFLAGIMLRYLSHVSSSWAVSIPVGFIGRSFLLFSFVVIWFALAFEGFLLMKVFLFKGYLQTFADLWRLVRSVGYCFGWILFFVLIWLDSFAKDEGGPGLFPFDVF